MKNLKEIVENLEIPEPEHGLTETTLANKKGLRLITCGSCMKKLYEDKFMLNRLSKRYRSCIDCVMRQRKHRQIISNKNPSNISDKQEDIHY